MALALGIRPSDEVFVNDTRLTVGRIFDPWRFEFVVDGENRFVVSDEEWTEVLPEVWVSVGGKSTPKMLRVMFDAPKDIPILRGKLYRNQQVAN